MGPEWSREIDLLSNISLLFSLVETGFPHPTVDPIAIGHRCLQKAKAIGVKKNHWCTPETAPSNIKVTNVGFTTTTLHDAFIELPKDLTRYDAMFIRPYSI